jgi:C1A family cysteine protease
VKPPPNYYKDAKKYKAVTYRRVADAVTAPGMPRIGLSVVFRFTVYESFESDTVAKRSANAQMSDKVLGGHAVLAVGYDDTEQRFIVRILGKNRACSCSPCLFLPHG